MPKVAPRHGPKELPYEGAHQGTIQDVTTHSLSVDDGRLRLVSFQIKLTSGFTVQAPARCTFWLATIIHANKADYIGRECAVSIRHVAVTRTIQAMAAIKDMK